MEIEIPTKDQLLIAIKALNKCFDGGTRCHNIGQGEKVNNHLVSRRRSDCAMSVFLCGDGQLLWATNTACHAHMYDMKDNFRPYKGVKAIITARMSDHNAVNKEGRQFIDWLINRSVYKDCFFDTDADEVLRNQAFCIDPRHPSNLVAQAAQATRMMTEGGRSEIVRNWLELVGHGMNEDIAWPLAMTFKRHGGTFRHSGDIFTGHNPLSSSTWHCTDAITNMLERKMPYAKANYDERGHYSDVAALFCPRVGGNTGVRTLMSDAINLARNAGVKEVGVVDHNIFKVAQREAQKNDKVNIGGLPYKDFCAAFAKVANDHFKDYIK